MCINCATAGFDHTKADAFTEKYLGILNGAALSMMISIGHRTGLFDAMDALGPATLSSIAGKANLNERYVREWLGAVTSGGVVTVDELTETYELPKEHACWLTRGAGANNLAVSTQFVSVLGDVEDDIVACFEQGGGVPYSRFGRFHEVMAEESGQTVVAALDEHILPLIEGIESKLEGGIDVLDVGCGRGRAMLYLAEKYPASKFKGYDLSDEAVAWANGQAEQRGLSNVSFEVVDVTRWDEEAGYDLVTAFDAIHDQADPAHMLKMIHRVLKPGGVFLAQDIAGSSTHAGNVGAPLAPFIYTISTMHCMTVSLAQGGAGLGAAWGQELATQMMRDAGFTNTTVNTLDHDIMNVFYVSKKA